MKSWKKESNMSLNRFEDDDKIGNGQPPPPPPPQAPPRHRHGEHFCYCPSCDYQVSVEEGQKCNLLKCPVCGDRLRAVSTGEYRVSQDAEEKIPVFPLIATIGLGAILFAAVTGKFK